ncbi:MAG: hypothetical protein AAF702_21495 [Chloroflexota bacterium]
MDIKNLQKWVGTEEVATAIISAETANLMQATLSREPTFSNGDDLPPAWHWLYFHEAVSVDELGIEGHPKLGGFMPPVSFTRGPDSHEPPRRMWAGGKITFKDSIQLGEYATKRSTVKSITPKEGRSGKLVFVVVEHEVQVNGQTCLLEEQTIVYREPAQSNSASAVVQPAPVDEEFAAKYRPDPMLLFRYSALTFNTHRIHYDLDFCRNHEGYPDLVVHGPLTATLLLDLFYHQFPRKRIAGFTYRGSSPLFNPNPFTVHGNKDGRAWASNHEGGLAMSAQVLLK